MTAIGRRQLLLAGVALLSSGPHVRAQHAGHGAVQGRPDISGFATERFTHGGKTRRVFVIGEGPPVLLMHELPGMSWATMLLAQRLADRGFTVYLPLLFGGIGQSSGLSGYLQSCVGRDWDCSEPDGPSRVLTWLHALGEDVARRHAGSRMGAIGMCLTGSFPLALMDIPQMYAGVMSQPALPLGRKTLAEREGLGLTQAEIDRAVGNTNGRFLALRFSADKLCTADRFKKLKGLLKERLDCEVIPSGQGTNLPDGAHAVLTGWYEGTTDTPTRKAFEKVAALLKAQLQSN
jgi:dienelactone hydrolase